MKRFGLRFKFALVIVLLLATIFGAIGVILIGQNSHSLRDELNAKSKQFAALATTPIGDAFLTYQDSGQIKITQQIQAFSDLNQEVSNIAVVDTTGMVVFNQKEQSSVNVNQSTAASFKPIYSYDASGIIDRIVMPLIEENGAHRYNLVYFISSASVANAIHNTEMSILGFVLLGLLASIVLTYVLTSQIFVRPIRQVSTQALAISKGHLDQQIQDVGRDEVGDLARAVNTMADSLKADIAKLKETDRLKSEFLMIASHNLRTPLTIINGYMEQLHGLKVDPDLKEILDKMAVGGKRLNAFAEDMLTISQMESGENALRREPTQVAELIKVIADDFKVLTDEKKLTFTANIGTGQAQADISPVHVRSALWNLLDNALKFTDKGGWIKLEAKVDDHKVQIIVSDSGIGIAKAEIPKLFTKFHRGTSTLQYQYEGTGIGLYATKLVIEEMGGTITAASVLGQGSTFTVTLPLLVEATKAASKK